MLYGEDLEYIYNASISIKHNRFSSVPTDEEIDCEGLLMIPGLINAHTHIGDSIGKDLSLDLSFDQSINPIFGIKKKILESSYKEHLIAFMRNAMLSMLRRGITTFADFREGGLEGIEMLRSANIFNMHIIALGRINYYLDMDQIKNDQDLPEDVKEDAKKIIEYANGLGISGANEYSNKALAFFNSIRDDKIIAIHAAESRESYKRSIDNLGISDVKRIIKYLKPDILVHMTNASKEDLKLVSNSNIVICPRANAVLGVGIPDVKSMLDNNCNIAIGTDNVMLNSPDLFREMDYLFKISRALGYPISAKEILKMVTVNAAKMFRLESGYIADNRIADAIFIDKYSIDLEPMHDPYASIVHRVDANSIKAVMLNGEIVYGEL
jgi:cytosine/adenosine deaminase-related metal-dependent hydrolase